MSPEDSLRMWVERVTELENGLEEAIAVIRKLRNAAQWSGDQQRQIDKKIEKLTNIWVPF
jgi:ribosome recycling factor